MTYNFRENLRSELNFQDITIKELSARTGIPIASLDCYLGARATMPSVNAAFKIAQALQVSVEYLLIGKKTDIAPLSKRASKEALDLIQRIESLSPEQCRAIINLINIFSKQKA